MPIERAMQAQDASDISLFRVRFIKLGSGASGIDRYCIENGMIYIGFSSNAPDFFELARQSDWRSYKELLQQFEESRSISDRAKAANATKATNQVREVFEADQSTLWITFYGGYLYYGSIQSGAIPAQSTELRGCLIPLKCGWQNTDTRGNLLMIENLAGSLTKVQGFQATSCELKRPEIEYLERRLNGRLPAFIDAIDTARSMMENAVGDAIRSLQPKDFELFVEILFSRTWRRIGKAGGSLKFVDITFEDPMKPDRRIAVQVKSATSRQEIQDYLDSADVERYTQFFIVYHSPRQGISPGDFCCDNLVLVDCDQLSSLAVDAGLIHWLKEKTS